MSDDVDAIAAAVVRRLERGGGLVVRLADAQLDEIAERVYARVDERLAPRELADEKAPRRRGRRHKI